MSGLALGVDLKMCSQVFKCNYVKLWKAVLPYLVIFHQFGYFLPNFANKICILLLCSSIQSVPFENIPFALSLSQSNLIWRLATWHYQ